MARPEEPPNIEEQRGFPGGDYGLESSCATANPEKEPLSSPLLETKFYYPPPRPQQVTRPRLLARLNESLSHKLALVSAPAGYGKTTLVVEWVSQIPGASVAWLSLDDGDNDPVRFLTYLITALQRALPGTSERALSMLHAPRKVASKALPDMSLLNLLMNDLAQVDEPIILVLEDYHLIHVETIHENITYLLEHLPANVHLLLTSRAEPPLPLSRLRGRGQLLELRTHDLRFTNQEAGEFLNRSMKLGLSNEKLEVLSARTEGWIAGLLMAAISITNRDDVDTFIDDFAGSNRFIMDYLVEEVLQQQPDHIQHFLHHTCLLERLCGELCDEIMADVNSFEGRSDAEGTPLHSTSLLSSLERANLFIVPLDDRQEWYRYHRLFADLLRKRLGLANPELLPIIHQSASRWFERKGNLPEAIGHSFSGGDLDRAALLIENAAIQVFRRSETGLILNWMNKLPETVIQDHPSLGIYYSLALIMNNRRLEEVEAWLDQAQRTASEGVLDGEASALRGLVAMLRGEIPSSIALSRQALEILPEEQILFKSLAADNLGMCYVLIGDMPSAIQAFDEVVRMAERSGNTMMGAAALSNLAGLQFVQGQLRGAWANFQKILELTTDPGGRRLPVAGKALSGLGELAREWNDLEAAASYLDEAVELLSQFVEIGVVFCYLSLARVRQAQGDWESAWQLLGKAQELATETKSIPLDDRLVEVSKARFWILEGNYQPALAWAQTRRLEENGLAGIRSGADSLGFDIIESEYLTFARLYIAQGFSEKALEILAQLQAIDEEKGRVRRLVEVLCLQAVIYQSQGEVETALAFLQRALVIARPEGFVRTFIDEGIPMTSLLNLAIQRGIEPEYAGRLLATVQAKEIHAQEPSKASQARDDFFPISSQKAGSGLVEPLSDRELEVLHWLAAGLSNPEIGARLVISLSTVKGHTANIYSKLGVNSRTQAVAKARELGILA
jgi:LuxR family transcriptional regulator, maltose regulon positive regulatory protein